MKVGKMTGDKSRRRRGAGEEVQPTPQHSQLDFRNHCLLCLQPQHPAVLQEVSRRNPKLQNDFQPVLHYLTGTNPTYTYDNDNSQSQLESKKMGIPVMTSAPPLCPFCHATLSKLYELHEELLKVQDLIQKQTEKARKIVTSDGAEASRQAFFAKLTSDETKAVAQFVTNLHNKIIEEGTKTGKVKGSASTPEGSEVDIKDEDFGADDDREENMTNEEEQIEFNEEVKVDLETNYAASTSASPPERMEEGTEEEEEADDDDDDDEETATPKKIKFDKWKRKDRLIDGVPRSELQICDMCGKLIPFPKIVEHLSSHHVQDYVTPCPYPNCRSVFSCLGKMEKHLSRHQGTKKPGGFKGIVHSSHIKCDVCGVEVRRQDFPFHLQDHECRLKDKRLSCPIPGCSHKYALRRSLEGHLMSHDLRQKQEQSCPECQHQFKVGLEMEEHLKAAHGAVEEVIQCKHCPFLFPSWESLLGHLYEHRKSAGFTCDLCDGSNKGFRFAMHESLCQHYFNVHQLGKQFICEHEHCSKEFFSLRGLSSHVKTHDDDNPTTGKKKKIRLFKCDLCPDTMTSKESLINHKIREHGGPPLTCKFCPATFGSATVLRKHQQGHLGITRSHICKVEGCGKVYQSMSVLNVHRLAKHSSSSGSSKPFVCDSCGQGFSYVESLKGHVTRVHLGKPRKPRPRLVCEECGEDFAAPTSLQKHKLIHTGERPHECPTCGQKFRTKDVLTRHLKGHLEKGEGFKPNGPMKQVRKRVKKND